jgi:diguanylate cyclase (GGDEF)-like protein
VFLFFTIALRPRFRSLLAGLALMCLSHFVAAHLSGAFDPVTYGGIVSFYVTLSIFLAVGAYFLEAADRRNFLNRLRASLLYRQLESNAERDELTGLLNRRSLTRISGEIWNGPAGQSAVSAILLDIDHFKKFNDAHGHIEGDACIRTVAQCIRDTVDAASFVFRFGGEEILVLSCEQTPQQGLAAAEKIRAAIEGLKLRHNGISNLGAGKGYVTASLGVASALPAQTTLEKLLQKADDALYEAKGGGRNMVGLADGPNIRAEVA